MASFLDNCDFNATSTGTGDLVVATAVTGHQTPASANAVNAAIYRYYARSADLSQWEQGYGAYTVAGTTLARTTVLFNSLGTTAKISFSTVPLVAIVALAEDFSITPTTQTLTSGTGATYTTPSGAKWLEVYNVGGGGGGAGSSNSSFTMVVGSDGTASTFNSVNANPGKGAGTANTAAALGGTGGTGTATRRMPGESGGISNTNTVVALSTGRGGNSWFANGGGASATPGTAVGIAGATNTGGGGSGGNNNGGTQSNGAGGGGGGETAYLIINSPASTYTYTVGGGGAGGVSTTNGGAGGSGVIFVIEHYGT